MDGCTREGDEGVVFQHVGRSYRWLRVEVIGMAVKNVLTALDEAWDDETGFLGKLRDGHFDPTAGEDFVRLLSTIPPPMETIDAELVRLIWFAPTFIDWQIDRAAEGEVEAARLRRVQDQVHEEVVRILGMP